MITAARIRLLALVAIAAVLALIYHPLVQHQFLHWDDITYVVANPYLNHFDLAFVRWALTTTWFSYWHPLTWLSHGLDYALWGLDPAAHLLVNLALYGLVCGAVFAVTVAMLPRDRVAGSAPTRWNATSRSTAGAIAALLFAVHPQHIEVVAWIAERKELLSTLFYLATVLAWLAYGRNERRSWLLASYLLFLLAVMAKPMAITLPLVLLVLDIWPLGRLARARAWQVLVVEKLPCYAISLGVALLTLLSVSESGQIAAHPLAMRVLNAFNNAILYAWHWAWPFDLSAFYPFPAHVREGGLRALVPVALVLAITAFAVQRFRAGTRAWLVAWLVYLITLLPVIGLIHAGPQGAAERYAHLTTIAFHVLLAAGLVAVGARSGRAMQGALGLALLLVLTAFAVTSHRDVGHWRDDMSLWSAVARRFPGQSTIVHGNFGNVWYSRGDLARAEREYLLAIEAPDGPGSAYANLGVVLRAQGDHDHAQAVLEALAARHPNSGLPLQELGRLAEARGDYARAADCYRRAVAREAGLASSYFQLARLVLAAGDEQGAVRLLEQALAQAPDFVDARLLLAQRLLGRDLLVPALEQYQRAWRDAPTYAPAYQGLIACLRRLGRTAEAEQVLAQARRLRDFVPEESAGPT